MKIYLAEIEMGNYTLTTWATEKNQAIATLKKEWERGKKAGWAFASWSKMQESVRIWDIEQNQVEWR